MRFVSYLKPQDRKKANINTVKMLLDIANTQLREGSDDTQYWIEAKLFYSDLLSELCGR